MNKSEIIKIGKELIYIAGVFGEIKTVKKRNELLKKFNDYEKVLSSDNTKYSQTVLGFVIDLKGDLLAGRELALDGNIADQYINNYFVTKKELGLYRTLIGEKTYKSIFVELHKKNYSKELVEKAILEIEENFCTRLNEMDSKNISKNLLIFTLEKPISPLKSLHRLILFLDSKGKFSKEVLLLNTLVRQYKVFKKQVYNYGLDFISKKSYNYKYLKFEKSALDGELQVDLKVSDASFSNYRTGNPAYEYKRLLMQL